MVFASCLAAVVAMAQGLPVAFVPEELTVSSVRNDVVNVRCLGVAPLLHALDTEGMRSEVTFAYLLPCSAVTAVSGRPYLIGVQGFVPVAVLRAVRNQGWTAGVTTWSVRSCWHFLISLALLTGE